MTTLPPAAMYTILLSVPAYCDSEMTPTMCDAIEKAEYPERVTIGLCLQDTEEVLEDERLYRVHDKMEIVKMNWHDAKGAGYARHVIQDQCFDQNKHDFFLMIDSHSRFAKNWDTQLIREWHHASMLNGNSKVVLSTRPNGYDRTDTEQSYLKNSLSNVTLPQTLHKTLFLRSNAVPWNYPSRLKPHSADIPRRSYWICGGFAFGPAAWCQQVPVDPHIPFNGEEDSLTIRSFTHGWNIYSPVKCYVFHCYDNNLMESKTKYRPLYWEDTENVYGRGHETPSALEWNWTPAIINHFYYGDPKPTQWNAELEERYGLGTERTVKQYEEMMNVDFQTRSVNLTGIYL